MRGYDKEGSDRRHVGQLNLRFRAEFVAGAEEGWRKRTGRPMTVAELERVLRRYPGTSSRTGLSIARWVHGVGLVMPPTNTAREARPRGRAPSVLAACLDLHHKAGPSISSPIRVSATKDRPDIVTLGDGRHRPMTRASALSSSGASEAANVAVR
jgi:hypothetical protein